MSKSETHKPAIELQSCQPTQADGQLVMQWRNDPATRRNSFHQDRKIWQQFWPDFRSMVLRDIVTPVFATVNDERMAFLRFEHMGEATDVTDQPGVEISINLAPPWRGKGLAARALEAAEPYLANRAVRTIFAQVRHDNHASLKVFRRAGYEDHGQRSKVVEDTGETVETVHFSKRIVQARTEATSCGPVAIEFFRPEDVCDRYIAWLNDSDLMKFTEARFTKHTHQSAVDYVLSSNCGAGARLWRIIVQNDGHVGNIRLSGIDRYHKRANIALVIGARSSWGRGIASTAVKLVARYGFETEGLNKLTAGMYSPNTGSIRAFEKAGFIREATLRQQHFYDGGFVDGVVMGRFAEPSQAADD